MDELTIGDKIYISSKRAAAITGYAKDYVGQLCREGHVEAKMVGRSWYVLESSIRTHRFGASAQSNQVGSANDPALDTESADGAATATHGYGESAPAQRVDAWSGNWEAPKYTAQEAPAMPALAPEPEVIEPHETLQSLDMSEDRQSLTEMQTAWKEWFENKHEPVLASEAVQTGGSEEAFEAEANPAEERANLEVEEPAEEAVPVAVHRIPDARSVAVDIPPRAAPRPHTGPDPVHTSATTVLVQEKRIRRGYRGPTNLVYMALLVAAAGIVIAIGFIGSGFADTYLGNNPAIEYLGGASSISK